MGKELMVGEEIKGSSRIVSEEKMVDFEKVVWVRVANVHSDPAAAKKVGMSKPIASGQNQLAFLHELMEQKFSDGWVFGGKISVRWVCPVYAGDSITPFGKIESITDESGKKRAKLEVWCENQQGKKTAIGQAQAYL